MSLVLEQNKALSRSPPGDCLVLRRVGRTTCAQVHSIEQTDLLHDAKNAAHLVIEEAPRDRACVPFIEKRLRERFSMRPDLYKIASDLF